MITGYLVGDQRLVERLRALPAVANSGLVRGITQLGIDLQRTVQRSRASRLSANADLRVEQNAGAITASLYIASRNAAGQERGLPEAANIRVSLQHKRKAFAHPIAAQALSVAASDRAPVISDRSFLRSALDNMTPAARDGVEDALTEALSQ